MKNFYNILSVLFIAVGLLSNAAEAQSVRYRDPVFSNVTVTSNVKYGRATTYLGYNKDLYLDIYRPTGDVSVKRPLVVMIFGGSFLVGRKNATDMVAWGKELAKHGYVCASIDYRLGFTIGSQRSAVRAVYRAVQDARAAMRFLVSKKTTYGIDTDRIFIGGESAGAITALHAKFMDTDAKRPSETRSTYSWLPESSDMGCLDCSGNTINAAFNIKGVVNLWGALKSVDYIDNANKTPVVSIHGEDDTTVPINEGAPYNATYLMPTVQGSRPITNRLVTLNTYNEFYPYRGEGHVFYGTPDIDFPNSKWPGVFQQGKNFLYTRLQQLGNVTREGNFADAKVEDNRAYPWVYAANGNATISWEALISNVTAVVSVYNLSGQLMTAQTVSENEGLNRVEMAVGQLPAGVYIATLQTKEGYKSCKFVVQ